MTTYNADPGDEHRPPRSIPDMSGYISNRVFDGIRVITGARAEMLRENYRRRNPQVVKSGGWGSD